MKQSGFPRIGIRAVASVLIILPLLAASLAEASEAPAGSRYVETENDGLAKYLLDTATVKRHPGLSGQSLVDVWIEGRFDAANGSRVQALLGGYPPGIDYSKVGKVRVRYLFKIDGFIPQLGAKTAVLERQYFDLDGGIIRREPFKPPANASEWRSLDETEDKALQALMQEPAFQTAQGFDEELLSSAAVKALDEGFLGRPWGTRPAGFEGARHVADIAPKVSVYSADLDLSPILGEVSAYTTPRLVFAEDGGLVKVRVALAPRDYGLVYRHLVSTLGEPVPILYELRAGKGDFVERSAWLTGFNTKVVLTSWTTEATLEIGRRDALQLEGREFEETLAAAQLKQAQEYERQNRIVEASSIYQELLNGADSPHFYNETALERLTAYSGRKDAVEYLGKYRGCAFSRLRNVISGADQHWLRIELDHDARAQLQKQRPVTLGPEDRLADIAAVLCRVRVVSTLGKYAIIEQVWLDPDNRIVGGSPAWAPQDAAWPATYIRQACEDFLAAWFTVGGIFNRVTKE